MNYKEIQKKAAEIDATLGVDNDGYFHRVIHVVHRDGSSMILVHAHVQKHEMWYMVFSEHNGWHVFHEDDIEFLNQYEHVIDNSRGEDAIDEDSQ